MIIFISYSFIFTITVTPNPWSVTFFLFVFLLICLLVLYIHIFFSLLCKNDPWCKIVYVQFCSLVKIWFCAEVSFCNFIFVQFWPVLIIMTFRLKKKLLLHTIKTVNYFEFFLWNTFVVALFTVYIFIFIPLGLYNF